MGDAKYCTFDEWTEVIAVRKGCDDKLLLSDKVGELQYLLLRLYVSCKTKYMYCFNAYTFRTTKSPEIDHGSQTPASHQFPLGVGPWIDTSIGRVLT